jgi:hypothetical protein
MITRSGYKPTAFIRLIVKREDDSEGDNQNRGFTLENASVQGPKRLLILGYG